MPTCGCEFSVSLKESDAFARLSGDYNPLHVDSIVARRTHFGETVVHGIHLFLRALDEAASRGLLDGAAPAMLSATFDTAVATGSTVRLRISVDGSKILFSADAGGQRVFTGSIELCATRDTAREPDDAEFARQPPHDVDFPPTSIEGTVPLRVRKTLCTALFPSLVRLTATSWVADLLATTQIVGMRCPGMHSIYSGFRLRQAHPGGSSESMYYRVNGVGKRFQLVSIQVAGTFFAGTIEAFFRPRPTMQRTMKEVAAAIPPDAFSGHRVLILGGSRGLGELTAKIVAAGGANVLITYSRGCEDAERICADVRAFGHDCRTHQLDVVSAGTSSPPDWLTSSQFTHVYFFASPRISKNPGPWNEALFRRFTEMYVAAFAAIVECALTSRTDHSQPVHFLYPSSIFVTQPEAGFSEYAVAKAAGEALCDQLGRRSHALFAKPRLPRMRTDQTSSLTDVGAVDPFPVMFELIRNFHS